MLTAVTKGTLSAAALLLCLSSTALVVNRVYFQYPGALYLPPDLILVALQLFLFYIGFLVYKGQPHKIRQPLRHLAYFIFTFALILLGTNSIQYTPFPPIDTQLLRIEYGLHINMVSILAWVHTHPNMQAGLEWVYNSLAFQLCFAPLVAIVAGRYERLKEYYFLLLFTAFFGFGLYYFFPTTAPASAVNSPYFAQDQFTTGLKFLDLHHHIKPEIADGGMISLPSFHFIWAWLSMFLLRDIRPLFYTLIPLNLVLAIACVCLGWHYLIDLIGSLLILCIGHVVYYRLRARTLGQRPNEGQLTNSHPP